jgi:hypothetical protein
MKTREVVCTHREAPYMGIAEGKRCGEDNAWSSIKTSRASCRIRVKVEVRTLAKSTDPHVSE